VLRVRVGFSVADEQQRALPLNFFTALGDSAAIF